MGVSTLIFQPVAPLPVSPSSECRQNEITLNETWSNLTGFLDRLHQVPVFAPMTAAMESLSWFIRSHENIITSQGEYQTLRSQLETLFKDLLGYFSSATPPTMTTSILNLCRAIETELRQVYGTQDRGTISRLMQAEHDVDKITRCYRRIQGHLERVMLNASLNILRILDKQATVSV
ncbi:unnamed protein product [Rhizoctonia solani]|uniref:Uncharacterized protein n=1 Tax=Rhizoctonia solani TaxID=456999 RepID=A0A8H3E0F4_9AGAM|nr:unnamed protein product [Rhizoctonia solani]